MAQLHRVDAIWQFFPAKIYAFIRWNVPQSMQMDRLPPSFGKNPFRNLFNSLSKINPTANTQNMPVGMERKHRITKSKQRGKKKKERRKKNRTGGWSDRCAGSSIPIVSRDRVQKFEVGRSIDGPITYLIGYASIIVAAVNCQQSWTFRLRPFDVFAHVRIPIKFDE